MNFGMSFFARNLCDVNGNSLHYRKDAFLEHLLCLKIPQKSWWYMPPRPPTKADC